MVHGRKTNSRNTSTADVSGVRCGWKHCKLILDTPRDGIHVVNDRSLKPEAQIRTT
jgi:hypothetical protein